MSPNIPTQERTRIRRDSPVRRIVPSLVFSWFALILFGMAGTSLLRDHRIAANPHVAGRIERVWVKYGKSRGLFADVTFSPANDGGSITCRVKGLRIGNTSDTATTGDAVDLVPVPGAGCARPEVAGNPSSRLLIAIVIGLGLVFVLGALKAFKGGPLFVHRRQSI
jgi:hypothetical protein